MKSAVFLGSLVIQAAIIAASLGTADEPAPKTKASAQESSKAVTVQDAPAKPEDLQAKRIESFKQALDGVVFRGTFQMTNDDGLKGKAPLTKPIIERYEIDRVSKGVDDNWVVFARIQYADRDVRVPVPVRVVWAEDTPVITLESIPIPLIGDYSARVVIHDGFYAGTWSGKGYGGVLAGQIIKKADEAMIKKMEDDGWNMRMPTKAEKEAADKEAPSKE